MRFGTAGERPAPRSYRGGALDVIGRMLAYAGGRKGAYARQVRRRTRCLT